MSMLVSTDRGRRGRLLAIVLVLLGALVAVAPAARAAHRPRRPRCAKRAVAHKGRCLDGPVTGFKPPAVLPPQAPLPLQAALAAAAKAPQHAKRGHRTVPAAKIAAAMRR